METFTAVAMCPTCQSVGLHPFRLPQRYTDDAVGRAWKKIGHHLEMLAAWSLDSGGHKMHVDPEDAEVIRQCGCGREWAQA